MSRFLIFLATGFVFCTVGIAGEAWHVRGQVVDETGRPVADASVDSFWTGNGKREHADGTRIDPKTSREEMRLFWERVGEMQPSLHATPHADFVKTDAEGNFSMTVDDDCHTLMAMDRQRKLGGIGTLVKGREGEPIEIRLVPLGRVRGTFVCTGTGKPSIWNHVYVLMPNDRTRPLDSGRLVSCGSFESRFEVALPPGDYLLDAYGESTAEDDIDSWMVPELKFTVTPDKREVDLGLLELKPRNSFVRRMELAVADGTWRDPTKHYGEPAPDWQITDARGIGKDAKLSDLKGKWVLIDFWGLGCRPCLREHLPKLAKFYDEHRAQRDQFEIVSICNDFDGDLKSMADLDRELEPIVKHVWGGKTLPFPVVLDSTFETWKRFGLRTFGTVVLVNPEGKLVEGDEETLAKKLK